MAHWRVLVGGAFPLILMTAPSFAGPCTQDIDRVQAQVDARIDAVAGAGPAGPESNAARLHREPTPGSVAAAEQRLGEGRPMESALAALARARTADSAGDRSACERALADAQRAISP
jgi:hypothetical protein